MANCWNLLDVWQISKCDTLRDLVPFVEFKKREKHPLSSVTFSKVAGFNASQICSALRHSFFGHSLIVHFFLPKSFIETTYVQLTIIFDCPISPQSRIENAFFFIILALFTTFCFRFYRFLLQFWGSHFHDHQAIIFDFCSYIKQYIES